MLNKNIEYKSRQLLKFYSSNRQKWEDFYPSERWVFKKIAGEKGALGDVLDVGCACGGLSTALSKKFVITSYTGVDINKEMIDWAGKKLKLSMPANFIAGDIVKLKLNDCYDTVFSLSCADWNIETDGIINACWQKVKRGGYFIISLRLTGEKGVNDIKRSYQRIDFWGDEKKPGIANYVVCNFKDVLIDMKGLNPPADLIGAFGYWGRPSPTAVTPFDKLVFAVFYIRKGFENSSQRINTEFNLPSDIF